MFGLAAYSLSNSSREVSLPPPTGQYQVGRAIYDFIDQTRSDPFATDRRTHRELSVFVWYPAGVAPGSSPGPYLPASWQQALDGQLTLVDRLNGLMGTPAGNVHSHSFDDAPVSGSARAYPLLLFSPGLGLAAYEYSSILEDLASHGYVVAGVNPTYSTDVVLSGGRVVHSVPAAGDNADITSLVELWTQDLRFVVQQVRRLNASGNDRLTGRLQTARIGYFGHSIGGAAATAACYEDSTCAGAVDIDGDLTGEVLNNGLGKPFMFLAHDDAFAQEAYLRSQVGQVLKGVPAQDSYVFRVGGSGHLSFTDRAQKFNVAFVLLRANGKLDPTRAARIASAYVGAFFQNYLLERPSSLLSGSPAYPEVVREFA